MQIMEKTYHLFKIVNAILPEWAWAVLLPIALWPLLIAQLVAETLISSRGLSLWCHQTWRAGK